MRTSHGRRIGTAVLALLLLGSASTLQAQQRPVNSDGAYDYEGRDPGPVPMRLRHFEGTVTVQRASVGETSEAIPNLPLEAGDRLWTEQHGRAELMLSDGSFLWIGEGTTLDLVALDDGTGSGTILRLWSGAAIAYRPDVAGLAPLRIDGSDSIAIMDRPGLSRVDWDDEQRLWLSVFEGEATLSAGGIYEAVRGGEQAYTEPGTAPSQAGQFSTASLDDFGDWQQSRWYGYAETTRHVAQRDYIPAAVRPHATELETGGSWFYYDDFGSYAWRPTVAVGWSPYNHGRWVWGYGGWTWVPRANWGWATAHYGRWHHLPAQGWVWFPGRVCRPAWVSWYVGYGHVGWSPIGYYNRPFISINLWFGGSWGYGNGYHGGYSYKYPTHYTNGGRAVAGRGYARGGDSSRGWTLIDAADFGRGDPVRRAVRRDSLPSSAARSAITMNGNLRQRSVAALAAGRRGLATDRTAAGRGVGIAGAVPDRTLTSRSSAGSTAAQTDRGTRGAISRDPAGRNLGPGGRTAGDRGASTRGTLTRPPGSTPAGDSVRDRVLGRASSASRPSAGRPSISRRSTSSRPSISSRPSTSARPPAVSRPSSTGRGAIGSRPSGGGATSPSRPTITRRSTGSRPGGVTGGRPTGGSRPGSAVGGRPSVGSRPAGRPAGVSRGSSAGRSSGRSAVSRGRGGKKRR